MENPDALPRVSIPPEVTFAADPNDAAAKLPTLDPARAAILEAPPRRLDSAGATAPHP